MGPSISALLIAMILSGIIYTSLMISYALAAQITVRAGAVINSVRQESSPNSPAPGWSEIGCYIDHGGARTLEAVHMIGNTAMTPAVCTQFCASQGKGFAGVESDKRIAVGSSHSLVVINHMMIHFYSAGCDGVIQLTGTPTAETDCSLPCAGDSSILCGGPSRLRIYTDGLPSPAIMTGIGESFDNTLWSYVGCYSDTPTRLMQRMQGEAVLTVDECVSICGSEVSVIDPSIFFTFTGIENADECWCTTFDFVNTTLLEERRLPDIACQSFACHSDQTKACGGADTVALYQQPTQTQQATNFANPMSLSNLTTGPGPHIPINGSFTLSAVLTAPPHTSLPINLATLDPDPLNTLVNEIGTQSMVQILSTCPICSQPPVRFIYNDPFNFHILYAMVDETKNVDLTGGFPVNIPPGGNTNFRANLDPYLTWGMGGYALVLNPLDPSNQTLALSTHVTTIFPTILSPTQDTIQLDLFAPFSLCSNMTSSGRLDVVYNGIKNQVGLNLTDCNDIVLVVNLD